MPGRVLFWTLYTVSTFPGWEPAPGECRAHSFQNFQMTLISPRGTRNPNCTRDPGIQIQPSIPFALKKAGTLSFVFDISHSTWYLAYYLAPWPCFSFQIFLLLL